MSETESYHYGVMARAIDYIGERAGDQLALEDVAAATGLSPAHFQRVFSQWVGVSPKRYQQYLTLDHAKSLLANRFTLLDTAAETGLSGTGRLHDLFLRWEAMTPGDYAQGGAGLELAWDWVETPFGEALLMVTDRGIAGLAFSTETGRATALADMKGRWPKAEFVQDAARVAPYAQALFAGEGEARLHLIGAPFQIKVWEALLRIPTGHVTTYSEIAGAIGNPKAVRAVGTAVGRNPVSWLIPCHRAIRKSGGLGGYHWGLPVKRALLAWEAARYEGEREAG
ncbi:MAG: bifunctional helix-turn-helix domain-containing protein/methylated-DNA--[protein]-cysteine S-methyltransferase [Pseudomonadota bacterium]